MADTTITGLPNAATLTGAERVPMDQAGMTVDVAVSAIAALAPGTDLAFTAATRTLTSSTGADVVLPVATTSDAGLESAADKTKLNGIASGATVNSTDAQLRDRATHTGTQAAATIAGLAGVATSGTYGDLSGRPTLGTAAPLDVAAAGDASASQVVTGNDSRLSDARTPTAHSQAASTISDSTVAGRALLTAADSAAQRSSLGLGTAALGAVSSAAPQALGATAAAGTSGDVSRADHIHARSTYADLGAIGDGLVLVISNKGETATAATNYAEVPVPVPSGSFTLTAVRFGSHIDTTGSSSSTFNAYKRTAGGTKTSVLTGNATLASAASLVDVSGTITGGTFAAGDRIGVDLVGAGTGAQGLFAQFIFTRSAT